MTPTPTPPPPSTMPDLLEHQPAAPREAEARELEEIAAAIQWQAEHCRANDAPITARIVTALLALIEGDAAKRALGARLSAWPGDARADAMALRLAGGLHWLHRTHAETRLGAIYDGTITAQPAIDAIILAVARDHEPSLRPWLDGPPQTNEAGRSAAIVAGLLTLAAELGGGGEYPKLELNEIGASAGANTMIERYAYDLGGVRRGPPNATVLIRPAWRGPPPPSARFEIAAIAGCDRAPIDLADPAQALRLESYIWPEQPERVARLAAITALARARPPHLARANAADWLAERLAAPQDEGVVRVVYHSIVWQYLDAEERARIEALMAEAGARATPARPLAWVMLETDRARFRHELRLRHWPHAPAWRLLGAAHAHGAWVEWFAA